MPRFRRACHKDSDSETLGRSADPIRNRERLIGAVEKFDGHENHLFVAEILEVVNLELTRAVGLVPCLAGLVGVFDRGAVMDMLTAAAPRHRGPEIIEDM